MTDTNHNIEYSDFLKVDIRVGTVIDAQEFPEAKRPAIKLWVDFGPDIGVKKSSAQITQLYKTGDLLGRQVMGVVNFPEKQIGKFMSQALILGFTDPDGYISLAAPDHPCPNGSRLH